MSEREEKFEKMLLDVQSTYDSIVTKMEALKAEGKEKTVTYRELMGNKLMYQNMLTIYRFYGLTEKT